MLGNSHMTLAHKGEQEQAPRDEEGDSYAITAALYIA